MLLTFTALRVQLRLTSVSGTVRMATIDKAATGAELFLHCSERHELPKRREVYEEFNM